MTPQEHRELFQDALYKWLEANGVGFTKSEWREAIPAHIDLNKLKIGLIGLIKAHGGSYPYAVRKPQYISNPYLDKDGRDYYDTDYSYERDGWQDDY